MHGLKGRPKSPEHIAKIRANAESRRGVPLSDATRAKVSAALKGRRPKNLASLWEKLRGRTLTAEHRAKLSKAHKARHPQRSECAGVARGKRATIYGLASSRDGRIRYVGQTAATLQTRFRSHDNACRNGKVGPLYNWMRKETTHGYTVFYFEIERDAEYNSAERRWIAWYRNHGASLLNQTDGGMGNVGYVVSDETRQRMRAARIGKKLNLTAEQRQKLARRVVALTSRADIRAKISAGQRGKPKDPESIRKRTETRRANGGYTLTPEQKAARAVSAQRAWERKKEAARVAVGD